MFMAKKRVHQMKEKKDQKKSQPDDALNEMPKRKVRKREVTYSIKSRWISLIEIGGWLKLGIRLVRTLRERFPSLLYGRSSM